MKTHIKNLGAAMAAMALVGCVGMEDNGNVSEAASTRGQAISVVPEFQISGMNELPDKLFLTDLGLVVSEIRLVPIISRDGLAYASAQPVAMNFDLQNGELSRRGDEMILPHAGKYVVSLRLEPVTMLEGKDHAASVVMNGYVEEMPDFNNPAKTSDGTPLPLPFDEKPDDDRLTDKDGGIWTPFEYNSKQTVFYTFDEVEFTKGQQVLAFSFDVSDWAKGVTEPISKAVRNAATAEDGVDVTRQVESVGQGADVLIAGGVVRADQRP